MSDEKKNFGIFYPTHHAVAVLPSDDAAERGQKALLDAGVSEAEINLMRSDQVVSDIESGEKDKDWMARFKEALSLGVGTEGAFWQADYERAKAGAGFLVIRCESEDRAQLICDRLAAENPEALRRYQLLAIEDLLASVPG